MLICFTVSLRTLFVLNTVYRFSNYLEHLLGLKMGPQLYPRLGFLSVCLGQRVSYCIQVEDCGQKLKVYAR
mgnify:CR=1 FL=1